MEYLILLVLLGFSAIFSGATLGFLSLDKEELKRKVALGDQRAGKIYSVRRDSNLLLCTLLIGNVAVNSAISLILGHLTSGFLAGLLATFLIVIFGEILPQALFYKHAFKVGYNLTGVVRVFIIIFYPICKPLAMILNKLVGKELPKIWSRSELQEIIKLHEDSDLSDLNADEERIMLGALTYSKKKVKEVMTPRVMVFSLEQQTVLNEHVVKLISKHGFSRIPVYDKEIDNLTGVLYAKDLAGIEFGRKVSGVFHKDKFLVVSENEKIDNLLNKFFKKRIHLAIAVNEFGGFEGVITLEDVIEEIFKVEILDEKDTVGDLQKEARKRAKKIFEKQIETAQAVEGV